MLHCEIMIICEKRDYQKLILASLLEFEVGVVSYEEVITEGR